MPSSRAGSPSSRCARPRTPTAASHPCRLNGCGRAIRRVRSTRFGPPTGASTSIRSRPSSGADPRARGIGRVPSQHGGGLSHPDRTLLGRGLLLRRRRTARNRPGPDDLRAVPSSRLLFLVLSLLLIAANVDSAVRVRGVRRATGSTALLLNEIVATALTAVLIVLPWILGGLRPTREDLTWAILLAFAAGFLSISTVVVSAFDIARVESRTQRREA